MRETEPAAARLPLLFLVADTARAMTKLRARDRAQLVVFAYQAGLVGPAGRIDPAAARGGVSRLWGARICPPGRPGPRVRSGVCAPGCRR